MTSNPFRQSWTTTQRGAVCCCLLLAVAVGAVAAPSQPAATSPRALYQVRGADRAVVAQGVLTDERPSVMFSGTPGTANTKELAPQSEEQPRRWLVRLRSEPLGSFLLRERFRIAGAAPELSVQQRDALESAVTNRRSELEQAQQILIDDLLAQGRILAVHRRFLRLTNTVAVTARGKELGELRRDPRVASVQPDHAIEANLELSVPLINAPAVWAMTDPFGAAIRGHGITVAIIDTGVDYHHPDLGGCFGPGCKVVGGYDFVNNDGDPLDDFGHGTHVAGIVAANGVLLGVAPDANLLAYKALDAGGFGLESTVIAALERAVDPDQNPITEDGAEVINLSLGSSGAPDGPLSEAAEAAVAAGSVVVAAAGNSGAYATIGAPANAEHVIAVAASDNLDRIAYFSSRGPITGQDYIKPNLTAPGYPINSAALGGGHVYLSGTSMAAPHVAGAAALLKQRDPSANPSRIHALLAAGAHDLGNDVFTQGAGRIDLLASVQAKLLLDPPMLSFGAVDTKQAVWQRTRSVRIQNVGTTPQSIVLATAGPLPPGVQLAFTPAPALTLVPGEVREVQIVLTVDNAATPYPQSETLHFEAKVITTAGSAVRLPITFEKSDVLTLNVENPPGWSHVVFLRRSVGELFEKISGGGDFDRQHEFRLRPGTYHAVSSLWAGDSWAHVMSDDFVVDGSTEVTISSEAADHRVYLSGLIDEQGNNIDAQSEVGGYSFEAIDYDGYSLRSFGIVFGDTLLRLSDHPGRYQLRIAVPVRDPQSTDTAQISYLLHEFRPEGTGLFADWPLGLDARTAGKAQLDYADAQRLARGPLNVLNWLWTFNAVPDYGLGGTGLSLWVDPQTHSAPMRSTIYAPPSALTVNGVFAEFQVSEVIPIDPVNVWLKPEVLSGILGFPSAGRHAQIASIDRISGLAAPIPEPRGAGISIQHGGEFFASRIDPRYLRLVVTNDHIEPDWDLGLLLKDSQQNQFPVAMPYNFSCGANGTVSSGTLGVLPASGYFRWHEQVIDVPVNCFGTPLAITLSTSVDILDEGTPSTVELRLMPVAAPVDNRWWRPAPHLSELILLDNGVPARILTGDNPKLRLRWTTVSGTAASEVTVEYRLDEDTRWAALPLQFVGNMATAQLPLLDSLHRVSLRVTARGEDGGFEQQTLESLFLLGHTDIFRSGFESD